MTTIETPVAAEDLDARIAELAERLFGIGVAAFDAATIALGRRLGLYTALAASPGTAREVAAAAGIDARYAREWLEQQAAAGFIAVDDVDAAPDDRRFSLPEEAREILTDPESPASMGSLFDAAGLVGAVIGPLAEAYRTGEGFAYENYPDISRIQGDFNRPAFRHQLTQEWLPAVPGLVERLSAAGARVVELGCGEGWAAIAIAKAFPGATVDAYDLHAPSISAARRHASREGVADRVRFEHADVSRDLPASGDADLVIAIEMVHDVARPVEILAAARRAARPGGTVLVVDERTGESFQAPATDSMDAFFYAQSVLHCLPVGRAETPSAATGTVMRPSTLREYARSAGFAGIEVLDIEHDLFRFYRLTA
jgi:2-polyprenyl-3-methyl-5-hydroxy-6-metoxy-1,4-benzoquinol methylase